jgi:microcystin-dependent protein
MHSPHPIHRALVTYSNKNTGEIRIKIPALLGSGSEVSISYIGRKAPWAVPIAGDQIVVTADDENLTNIFWLQTDSYVPQHPTGSITAFAGSSAPTSWLLCYGQTLVRATYPDLFAVIGTTYNTGGEAGTDFRLPDLRGRTVAGIDNMGGTDAGRLDIANSSGTVVGSQYVTLTSAEMPSHTHIQNSHNHNQNAHGHDLGPGQSFGMSGTNFGGGNSGSFTTLVAAVQHINQGSYQGPYSANTNTATNIANTATNQDTGGGGAHNNMQPTMVLNYIIKI